MIKVKFETIKSLDEYNEEESNCTLEEEKYDGLKSTRERDFDQ